MKLKSLFVLTLCLTASVSFAEESSDSPVKASKMLACAQAFPTEILAQDGEKAFEKVNHPDAFRAEMENGEEYIQLYRNELCFATVSLSSKENTRLSNIKVKRILKEQTHFPVADQSSVRIKKERFFYTIGVDKRQTDLLMAADIDNRLMQVRMTCQAVPGVDSKTKRSAVLAQATNVAKTILQTIKPCR